MTPQVESPWPRGFLCAEMASLEWHVIYWHGS
jgi:hypothetical protein